MNRDSTYSASLTREQFCFHEMRSMAGLLSQGMTDDEAINRAISENLFQYPTERSLRRCAKMCVKRLQSMNDVTLIDAVAAQPADAAKQICLYAMMKDSRLICDFMLTVIAEKYRLQDFTFGRGNIRMFFLRLQEQDDGVAAWSPATITKIGQVITRVLVENEYLDTVKSEKLNPVLISRFLENAIRANHDEQMLPAFNCFG